MATLPVLPPDPTSGRLPAGPPPRPRNGGGGGDLRPNSPPRIHSAKLALVLVLASEAMLFTGLLGAFMVLRVGAVEWPPQGLPRLPIGVTWANTAILVLSAYTMWRAVGAAGRGAARELSRALAVTGLLGTVFLAVQGSEWVRLIGHGLTLRSGVYGGTFYMLIGAHGLHVLGAVLWLLGVFVLARRGRYRAGNGLGVELAGMYWAFVVGLWLVLFPAVYLL